MKNKPVLIKKPGPLCRNVVRISCLDDVPYKLRSCIHVIPEMILFQGRKGQEMAPLGSYIAWEHEEDGYVCYIREAAEKSLELIGGEIYKRTSTVMAQLLEFGGEIPAFMSGADIRVAEFGDIVLHATWGEQWACYGGHYMWLAYADGSFAMLDLESRSAEDYFLCDDYGQPTQKKLLRWLEEEKTKEEYHGT